MFWYSPLLTRFRYACHKCLSASSPSSSPSRGYRCRLLWTGKSLQFRCCSRCFLLMSSIPVSPIPISNPKCKPGLSSTREYVPSPERCVTTRTPCHYRAHQNSYPGYQVQDPISAYIAKTNGIHTVHQQFWNLLRPKNCRMVQLPPGRDVSPWAYRRGCGIFVGSAEKLLAVFLLFQRTSFLPSTALLHNRFHGGKLPVFEVRQ